jgi:hypothetical protein
VYPFPFVNVTETLIASLMTWLFVMITIRFVKL